MLLRHKQLIPITASDFLTKFSTFIKYILLSLPDARNLVTFNSGEVTDVLECQLCAVVGVHVNVFLQVGRYWPNHV